MNNTSTHTERGPLAAHDAHHVAACAQARSDEAWETRRPTRPGRWAAEMDTAEAWHTRGHRLNY